MTGSGLPGAVAPPTVPTLARLEAAALDVIQDVGYGQELQADVRGFVGVRLRSLRTGSAGRFFEGGHPADIGALLRRNVVLAIEDVANDEDKAFLIGTLIIRIVEHLRMRARTGPADGLRHVIVIEEAHRLLRAGPGGRRRPRGGAVRQPAGRDPGLRRGHRDRRADPGQARPRRGEEHRAQGACTGCPPATTARSSGRP